jgi:3-dehydroshikimate dehydratase
MNRGTLLALAVLLIGGVAVAQADTFVVTSTADDGSANTLRWAIMQNNAHPGGNTIQIVPSASPFRIKLNSLLLPIVGPATVTATGSGVVIDGGNFIDGNNQASCPGETGGFGPNVRSLQKPGLAVVDSGNVEISNLEITNFCIGVLLLRSHDNHVHHNTIHHTSGAAGVLVTGDDGTAAGGSTTGLSTRNLIEYNTVYETGDGMECTRGTSFSTYQFNTMFEFRDRPNVPYSQGIECAGAGNDNNIIQFNAFKGYSDGLQMNTASNLTILGNTIAGTTYAITTSGANVLIKNNVIRANRMGVGASGNTSHVTITQNTIFDNGRPLLSVAGSAGGTTNPNSPALLGIDFGVNGVTPNDSAASCADGFPDCAPPQNFPVLTTTSVWTTTGVVLNGTLASRPNQTLTIEFFGNHRLNTAGFAEGEVYLGSVQAITNATGNATFSLSIASSDPLKDGSTTAYFTTTATNASGSTAEFSAGLQLSKAASEPAD